MEIQVPTLEEIAQLPRWAQVAFAARCARRVQPLFVKFWPGAPLQHIVAVELAITIAEHAATAAKGDVAVSAFAGDAQASSARSATDAGKAAARSAAYAARAVHFPKDANVAVANAVACDASQKQGIRADFERLRQLAQAEHWTDDTPVPPTLFPPLNQEPVAAPEPVAASPSPIPPDRQFGLIIRAIAEEGVTAETVKYHLIELYKALNEYTLARYGCHLTRGEFRRLILQETGVGV